MSDSTKLAMILILSSLAHTKSESTSANTSTQLKLKPHKNELTHRSRVYQLCHGTDWLVSARCLQRSKCARKQAVLQNEIRCKYLVYTGLYTECNSLLTPNRREEDDISASQCLPSDYLVSHSRTKYLPKHADQQCHLYDLPAVVRHWSSIKHQANSAGWSRTERKACFCTARNCQVRRFWIFWKWSRYYINCIWSELCHSLNWLWRFIDILRPIPVN